MVISNIYVVFITKRLNAFRKQDQAVVTSRVGKNQESYLIPYLMIAFVSNCFLLDSEKNTIDWKLSQDACPVHVI